MKISYTEKRVMDLIWENEPVRSRNIVNRCEESFGWKSTTTFTFLKRLSEKGIIVNDSSIIRSLVSKDEIEQEYSKEIVQNAFNDSLPTFLTAFLHDKKLNDSEYEELINLINSHKKVK